VQTSALPAEGGVVPTADVAFVGPVYDRQKTAIYRHADVFVLPSHSENFGVVVLEALACGLPVITTKATPWQELNGFDRPGGPSTKQRAGWWIEVGVDPLVEALREAMLATDEQLAGIGDNARWLAQERYSWPAAARSMKRAYDWVLHGGTVPDCIRM
jgi:glycosyltransferase involved in cell wall biosynthesis